MPPFAEMFRAATGHGPPGYQEDIARDGLPADVEVPNGAGRTGIILAWLWRRLDDDRKNATPRRLVYALPQGALTEPAANGVRTWLANLDLTGEVALQVVMGTGDESHGEWREDMHKPAIIIGTVDVLLSKALLRGYDTGRVLAPIDFALVTNGAHWVLHEARLCRQSAATLRQLAVFAKRFGTAEPFGLSLMSASAGSPGTSRTVIVADRVETAVGAYSHLRGEVAKGTLLHSRFRGIERAQRVAEIAGDPGGRFVVVTEAALAGLDLDATPVITGGDPVTECPVEVLGLADVTALFDTSADLDFAHFVSDSGDLDAEVAWAAWTPRADGSPDPEVRVPPPEYRCRISPADVARLAAGRPVWRFDRDKGEWVTTTGSVRPGELLLVNAADGGYSPETGLDPHEVGPVPGSPELLTSAEPEQGAETERPWQSLDEHSTRTRDQAAALLRTIQPDIPNGSSLTAEVAAFLHDVGKAHEIWQDALCALAPSDDAERIAAGRPWAKSGTGASGRLEFRGGVSFKHELGSLLLINGPLRDLLAEAPDQDLARFLVLAHHGRLRVRVQDPGEPDGRTILGLEHGATSDIPPILGHPATTLTVDLDQFAPDGDWTAAVGSLRDRYGPFVLAYLETVVRMADWRASGGRELPASAAEVRTAPP